jgi:hypothetical protein
VTKTIVWEDVAKLQCKTCINYYTIVRRKPKIKRHYYIIKEKCKMDLIVHGKKSETCAQIEPQVSKPKRKGKGFLNAAPTSNK